MHVNDNIIYLYFIGPFSSAPLHIIIYGLRVHGFIVGRFICCHLQSGKSTKKKNNEAVNTKQTYVYYISKRNKEISGTSFEIAFGITISEYRER